jgi:hypothetical protein
MHVFAGKNKSTGPHDALPTGRSKKKKMDLSDADVRSALLSAGGDEVKAAALLEEIVAEAKRPINEEVNAIIGEIRAYNFARLGELIRILRRNEERKLKRQRTEKGTPMRLASASPKKTPKQASVIDDPPSVPPKQAHRSLDEGSVAVVDLLDEDAVSRHRTTINIMLRGTRDLKDIEDNMRVSERADGIIVFPSIFYSSAVENIRQLVFVSIIDENWPGTYYNGIAPLAVRRGTVESLKGGTFNEVPEGHLIGFLNIGQHAEKLDLKTPEEKRVSLMIKEGQVALVGPGMKYKIAFAGTPSMLLWLHYGPLGDLRTPNFEGIIERTTGGRSTADSGKAPMKFPEYDQEWTAYPTGGRTSWTHDHVRDAMLTGGQYKQRANTFAPVAFLGDIQAHDWTPQLKEESQE